MQQKVDLGNAVLKGVSRSFYLTIRILPKRMREPVSLGYLLARASDTIADTEAVTAETRKACLGCFFETLSDTEARAKLTADLADAFLSFQENEREKLLLEKMQDVWGWYDAVDEDHRVAISDVMKPILEGQSWDIDFFAIQKHEQIASAEDLERYCYQVAGSVGEFWGVVGNLASDKYSHFSPEKLKEYGVNYGKGLQLVNILRDLPADLKNGRCYLPDVDFNDKDAVLLESEKWRVKAREYLEQGLEYGENLRQKRVKVATLLPAMIGLKTLDLMEGATWEAWEKGIKVTRKEIRKSLWQSLIH